MDAVWIVYAVQCDFEERTRSEKSEYVCSAVAAKKNWLGKSKKRRKMKEVCSKDKNRNRPRQMTADITKGPRKL